MSTASLLEKQCSLLIHYDRERPSQKELREKLEKGDDQTKSEALQKIILLHLNGEVQPANMLMLIIQNVMPTKDKKLKKLLLTYFEIIEKAKDGKLLPEMILVVSHLRNNLEHSNEFIRGTTLRFLCKVKEPELLQPLIRPIIQNLEDRHSYVKRNAILAIYSIYMSNPDLLPDAPEIIYQFLLNPDNNFDQSCKRNAFIMLFDCDQQKAILYLRSIMDQFLSQPVSVNDSQQQLQHDAFVLVVLNLLRKMCKTNPREKSKYLAIIINIMSQTKSPSVMFQCATTLSSLSSSAAAIKAICQTYVKLLLTHSNQNVKLIVLDRLHELIQTFSQTLLQQQQHVEVVMNDMLRAQSMSQLDLELRRKLLYICCNDLLVPRTVDIILQHLKKEMQKTQEKENEYRKMIVQAFHKIALKYPQEASPHVLLVMDLLNDNASATDVILFVREIVECVSSLKSDILNKLCNMFDVIQSARVYRIAMWILGDYSVTREEMEMALQSIQSMFHNSSNDISSNTSSNTVRADGTYMTQQVNATVTSKKSLLQLIMESNNNHYLASVTSSTLCKLAIGYSQQCKEQSAVNVYLAKCLLLLSSLAQVLSEDKDTLHRIQLCIDLVWRQQQEKNNLLEPLLITQSKEAFGKLLQQNRQRMEQVELQETSQQAVKQVQVDDLLVFSHLKNNTTSSNTIMFDEEEEVSNSSTLVESNKLHRVTQLTGFSDPVYAEAVVTIHQYDIVLDILMVNQTNDTLQNVSLELCTVGDLKLTERLQQFNLGPSASHRIKASIKVSSTDNGSIFGNIVYDVHGNDKVIVLNDLQVDIMDYIHGAYCDDTTFRSMWFEFEWENKISLSYDPSKNQQVKMSASEYLHLVAQCTHMTILTSVNEEQDCEFLSANLYAKSSFNEDALLNVSIEREDDGKIEGFVRIRSKTQGIALALGNIILREQKRFAELFEQVKKKK